GLAVGRHALVAVNRAFAGVVAGRGQGEVAVEALQQPAQVFDAAADVLRRIVGIGDPEPARGGRHQLHQALRPGARERVGVERGFGVHDRAHDRFLDAELGGSGLHLGRIGRGVQAYVAEIDARQRRAGVAGLEEAVVDRAYGRSATTL